MTKLYYYSAYLSVYTEENIKKEKKYASQVLPKTSALFDIQNN
jgi:hypothetical protein